MSGNTTRVFTLPDAFPQGLVRLEIAAPSQAHDRPGAAPEILRLSVFYDLDILSINSFPGLRLDGRTVPVPAVRTIGLELFVVAGAASHWNAGRPTARVPECIRSDLEISGFWGYT